MPLEKHLSYPWTIAYPTPKMGRKEPYIAVTPPGTAPIALSQSALVDQHNELLIICKRQEAELEARALPAAKPSKNLKQSEEHKASV